MWMARAKESPKTMMQLGYTTSLAEYQLRTKSSINYACRKYLEKLGISDGGRAGNHMQDIDLTLNFKLNRLGSQ